MKILQLSAHFAPNIGGVETHLSDLVDVLIKKDFKVFVLTYMPLTAKVDWKIYERSRNFQIYRILWVKGFFYSLVQYPILEFIYLLPGLFIFTPFVILLFNPKVIHAHGLVAGFVGVFWGRIFRKRIVISTHSIYSFPKVGLYRWFVKWIFGNADVCLGLSKQAVKEIAELVADKSKVEQFTYWINLDKFSRIIRSKQELDWEDNFVVLFVGRLVKEKGLVELLDSVKSWDKKIILAIIGTGPLSSLVSRSASRNKNVQFIGSVVPEGLAQYYSGADVLVVPSNSEEGFGRVIIESLACGTPVVGANRGAIPEAINQDVGMLIDVTPENLKRAVEYFYHHKNILKGIASNCRKFAERRYSEKNVEAIIKSYEG